MWNYTIPHGVETHCIHTGGVPTVRTVRLATPDVDGPYDYAFGDGDGTVNAESLRFCGAMGVASVVDLGGTRTLRRWTTA